jgi:hypothetical protein
MPDNVDLSVCQSVGVNEFQQVSMSMKCLKYVWNHNVSVFYALCIT